MKKLIIITQSKGGAGKSILTFLLAEKYPDAVVFDMDNATNTTALQLQYRNPIPITFLDNNNVIDRGRFNTFLEEIHKIDNNLSICDMGASVSEQFPFYLSDVSDFLSDVLTELQIDLEIMVIVGGGNIFTQTTSYLEDLRLSVNEQFTIRIMKNEYYDFNQDQNLTLEKYANKHRLEIVPFNISRDMNQSTQNRLKEVLKSGKGIETAGSISRGYFQKAIKLLAV